MTIDWWTLGIQTVNVAILIWLLQRFFWRPVSAMIEQRRVTSQQILTDAETKRTEATAALAEIEQTRAGFAKEREAILEAAHASAEHASTASLEAAKTAAAELETAAHVAIETEKDAADKAWTDRASLLAIDIAGHLAARLDGPTVRSAFLDWLLAAIRALPEPERQAVAANGVALEAISATPLDPADQDRYRTLIDEAFGAHPQLDFKTDPALISGLELRGTHLVVSNSWRADLSKILADLKA